MRNFQGQFANKGGRNATKMGKAKNTNEAGARKTRKRFNDKCENHKEHRQPFVANNTHLS
ncbi:hypothetical protein ACT7CZ_12320 [Bacillus cereus]